MWSPVLEQINNCGEVLGTRTDWCSHCVFFWCLSFTWILNRRFYKKVKLHETKSPPYDPPPLNKLSFSQDVSLSHLPTTLSRSPNDPSSSALPFIPLFFTLLWDSSPSSHLYCDTGQSFVILSLWLPPGPFTPLCGLHTPHLRGD